MVYISVQLHTFTQTLFYSFRTSPEKKTQRHDQAVFINRFFLLICADTRSVWPAMMETLTENHPLWPRLLSKQWRWEWRKKKPNKCHSHKKTPTGSKQFTDVSAVFYKLAKKKHRNSAADMLILILTPFLPMYCLHNYNPKAFTVYSRVLGTFNTDQVLI